MSEKRNVVPEDQNAEHAWDCNLECIGKAPLSCCRLLAAVQDVLVVADLNGNILDMNAAAIRSYGFKNKEAYVGMSIFELMGPENKEKVAEKLAEALKSGSAEPTEYRIVGKDNRDRIMEITASAIKDANGTAVAVLGCEREVTGHKNVEHALRVSEEKYRMVFQGAVDAIMLADVGTGRVSDVNEAAERMLKRPREKLIGMHPMELHAPKGMAHYKQDYEKRRQLERGDPGEIEFLMPDGTFLPVEVRTTTTNIAGVKTILGVFRDISERKRTQQVVVTSTEPRESLTNGKLDYILEFYSNLNE
ncbi:MAG: PAS domain-containing protein, partial [Pseudomonadota bacterium]